MRRLTQGKFYPAVPAATGEMARGWQRHCHPPQGLKPSHCCGLSAAPLKSCPDTPCSSEGVFPQPVNPAFLRGLATRLVARLRSRPDTSAFLRGFWRSRQKNSSGAEARVALIGLARGLKPPSPSEMHFSQPVKPAPLNLANHCTSACNLDIYYPAVPQHFCPAVLAHFYPAVPAATGEMARRCSTASGTTWRT